MDWSTVVANPQTERSTNESMNEWDSITTVYYTANATRADRQTGDSCTSQ